MDSDSDYDDIGESSGGSIINSVNDNNIRKSSKTNKDGKQVRGGDRQWSLQELFEDSDAFFVSELYKKIKLEFVTVRKRQFKHALVEDYRCKYGKKSGYISCSFVLRILFSSTDQSVKVETDGNAEHVHEPDPLFGLQGGVGGRIMYRWTPKMTEIIFQCVYNKEKPAVALQNMRDAGCFDNLQNEPSMEQVYNKIVAAKKALNPQPKMTTTHDMRQFVQNHVDAPADEMEAYIPFHDIDDEDPSKLRFTILFASKRSLSRCVM